MFHFVFIDSGTPISVPCNLKVLITIEMVHFKVQGVLPGIQSAKHLLGIYTGVDTS